MKEKILDLLSEHFKRTDGGISLISLGEKLKISQEELKTHLNELYRGNKISIRQGVNHKLIYLK